MAFNKTTFLPMSFDVPSYINVNHVEIFSEVQVDTNI